MNRFDGKVTVITGADATQCLTPLTRRGAWRERCRARELRCCRRRRTASSARLSRSWISSGTSSER
jgi:hypothetical protein